MDEEWLDSVTIRYMTEEDLPALEWDGEYTRYRRVYKEVYRNFTRGISLPYVAVDPDAGIIGQVFLTRKDPNPDYGTRSRYFFLSSFRVKPEYRGRGLGSRLLAACEKDVLAARLRDIYLNCAENNPRARSFYEQHGFKVVRVDSGTWSIINEEGLLVSEKQTAYLMKKALPRSFLGRFI